MFDRSLVTSGFDIETVVSEDYLRYVLLAQIEAGRLAMSFDATDPETGVTAHIDLHPPTDYSRRYEPHPDAPPLPEPQTGSFTVRLLPDGDLAFLHLTVWVTVTTVAAAVGPVPAGLHVDLELTRTEQDGFERDHGLRLRFVGLDDTTAAALRSAGVDPDPVEAEIRDALDRDLPLGVAQGLTVQQVRFRKFADVEQRSLGIYVDLALRSGPAPDAFVPPRGDTDTAQDFRPTGAPLAFATSPALFGLLGTDFKSRAAEPDDEGEGFRFPLRRDQLDPESDEIGRIKGVRIGPERLGIPSILTGRLMIDIHGEYTDAIGDPDFHLQILLRPVRDDDGLITWDLDVDVDLGLLATLLLIAAGVGLTLLFAPALAWSSTLVVGTLVGLAVLKGLVAEPLAAKLVEDHLDEDSAASLLDALPFRLPVSARRWDPFYDTLHQVVALADEDLVVDDDGLAFASAGLALDREPVPVGHVVIRDEERADGAVEALRYRVNDFVGHRPDFDALAPGTDRLASARPDPAGEPTLVSLTPDQLGERIPARKVLAPITYEPQRIHVVGRQIDSLLVLSRRERAEERQRLVDRFRRRMFDFIAAEFGDSIREQVTAELTEQLGRTPTADEVTEAFEAHVNRVIDGLMPGFEQQLLPGLLDAAIAAVLRFDLAPEELIEQQRAGVLILDGKEIIVRHNRDGTVTPYYRDHPDSDRRDNLLSLPHYSPPYRRPA